MKKIIKKTFVIVLCFASVLFSVACSNDQNQADEFTTKTKEVYALYVTQAQELGATPLTYEQWLVSIKGSKGDKGDKGDAGEKGDAGNGVIDAYINSEYELIIVLNSGEINCGKVIFSEEISVKNFIYNVQKAQGITKLIAEQIQLIADEKGYLDKEDALAILLDNYRSIDLYFELNEKINEIALKLEEHEKNEKISAVVLSHKAVYRSFINGLRQSPSGFQKEYNEKNLNLTTALQELLLELI